MVTLVASSLALVCSAMKLTQTQLLCMAGLQPAWSKGGVWPRLGRRCGLARSSGTLQPIRDEYLQSTNHSSPGQAGRTGAALGVAPRVVEVAAAGARGLGQGGVEDGGGGAGVGRVLGVGHLEAVAVQAARPVHVGGRGQRGRGLARQVAPAATDTLQLDKDIFIVFNNKYEIID